MNKRIITYLGIAMIAYTLGTMSTLMAESGDKKGADSAAIKQLSDKVDRLLANDEEIKSMLKKIYNRA